jgi:hypothetical protein
MQNCEVHKHGIVSSFSVKRIYQRSKITNLSHVPDGEATQRRELGEGLHTHGLAGDEGDDGGIAGLDELGRVLSGLAGTPIALLLDLGELAGNVGRVAIQDGRVAVGNLPGVVKHDDLSGEVSDAGGGLVLAVGRDVATLDVLDGDVLDVEADVVSGSGLGEGLVVHLHGLDLSGEVDGGEGDDHAGLDDAGLDTAHGDCSDTADLVHILKKTRFVTQRYTYKHRKIWKNIHQIWKLSSHYDQTRKINHHS